MIVFVAAVFIFLLLLYGSDKLADFLTQLDIRKGRV